MADPKTYTHPFAHHQITKYISAQIDALKSEKTQRQIAMELGYEKPNMVSMLKRGESRVPLDKLPALAKALHVDLAHLYRLAMEDYWPQQKQALRQIFERLVTANEMALIEDIRKLTNNTDPAVTPELRKRLAQAFDGNKE